MASRIMPGVAYSMYRSPTLKALPNTYTNISMITTGITAPLNTVNGFRRMCLKLRRSMMRESVSGAVRGLIGLGLLGLGAGSGLGAGAARVTGQGQEDIVEVRRVHRELLDVDRVLVQPVQHSPDRLHPAVARHSQGQRRRAGEPEPDVAARDLALELVRGALGHQAAPVQHRDPVGQLVGFLQV